MTCFAFQGRFKILDPVHYSTLVEINIYRISEKWENGFGHFSAFFELWTVFWVYELLEVNTKLKQEKLVSTKMLQFLKTKYCEQMFVQQTNIKICPNEILLNRINV